MTKSVVLCLTLAVLPMSLNAASGDRERLLDRPHLVKVESQLVCCLSREPVDGGRRIAPVYRKREIACNKGEEHVEMKFCEGVPR